MSEPNPLWRQAFDAVAQIATPAVTDVYASEIFATVISVVTQIQRGTRGQIERTSRHVLHELNLPAGSDITRLLREISRLRGEVAQLSERIDAQSRKENRAHSAKPTAASRSRSA